MIRNNRIYGSGYSSIEADIFDRDKMSQTDLENLRWKRLLRTLRLSSTHVPFYKKLFKNLSINADDIRCPKDLQLLPILNKSQLQESLYKFQNDLLHTMKYRYTHTSGTTGAGLIFPMTIQGEIEQWATWWRYRARLGIQHETWCGHFHSRVIVPASQTEPPFWRINYPGRQVLFSPSHMSRVNLCHYAEAIQKQKLPWLHGYPSMLVQLGGYLINENIQLSYTPLYVTVGSESLLPYQKTTIERAFGVPCRQHYGLAEAVANISECTHGRLHVDEDFSYVEFIPNSDGTSRIIGTSFVNDAFPLIRYDTGDRVILGEDHESCPCGLRGRIVKSMEGRMNDYILTPEGNRVSCLNQIFTDQINIRECQIVQNTSDEVEIKVVKGTSYSERDHKNLVEEVARRLGDKIRLKITFVECIQRTPTGKLRLVVSNIQEGKVVSLSERSERN